MDTNTSQKNSNPNAFQDVTLPTIPNQLSFQLDYTTQKAIENYVNSLNVKVKSYTTTARGLISAPQAGLIILNTTTGKLNFFTGTAWEAITSA
jgi:hypothetical protein